MKVTAPPTDPRVFREQLAQRIKVLRVKRGKLQQHFAQDINIPQSTYCRMETGQMDISIQRLHTIATGLGTNLNKLLDGLL